MYKEWMIQENVTNSRGCISIRQDYHKCKTCIAKVLLMVGLYVGRGECIPAWMLPQKICFYHRHLP